MGHALPKPMRPWHSPPLALQRWGSVVSFGPPGRGRWGQGRQSPWAAMWGRIERGPEILTELSEAGPMRAGATHPAYYQILYSITHLRLLELVELGDGDPHVVQGKELVEDGRDGEGCWLGTHSAQGRVLRDGSLIPQGSSYHHAS